MGTGKASGTELIRRMVSSEKQTMIHVATTGNYHRARDASSATNGVGSDSDVYFNSTASAVSPTLDSKTGNSPVQDRPSWIGLAHELIHADRANRGVVFKSNDMAGNYYRNGAGDITAQVVPREELATVGLASNIRGDIT